MKLFEKIKNWIIHLLGGYTRKEYNDSEDCWYKIAKEYAVKCVDEHEAYIAMLNCHNATAEAAQNVAIAADTIKDYCANRADCDGCPLHGECGCKTADKACPEYWD